MDFKLDQEALKAVLSKAIVDTLTPEKREEIISKSVENLLSTKVSDRYNAPTTIQSAFDTAVRNVAQQIATEMITADPKIAEKIKELFYTAWAQRTTGENQEKLVAKIADAIDKAFSNDRY